LFRLIVEIVDDEDGAEADAEPVLRLITVSGGTADTVAGRELVVADAEGPLSAMEDAAAAAAAGVGVDDDEYAESVVVVETETKSEAPEAEEVLAVTKTVLVLVPLAQSVVLSRVVSELSWPVIPPCTPDSVNLLFTSSMKSQARVVPGLLTRGRAKQEVLVEHGMTSQVPPEHSAKELVTQAWSPSAEGNRGIRIFVGWVVFVRKWYEPLQGSEAFKVANCRFNAWASRPFCNWKFEFARGRPAKVGAALMGENRRKEVRRTVKVVVVEGIISIKGIKMS
jgi:hypothetical protein